MSLMNLWRTPPSRSSQTRAGRWDHVMGLVACNKTCRPQRFMPPGGARRGAQSHKFSMIAFGSQNLMQGSVDVNYITAGE